MTPREHQDALLRIIDGVHSFEGATGVLPEPLREAFRAVPRHRFLHRFGRSFEFDYVRELTEQNLAEHLPLIYSNTALRHVDRNCEPMLSSNSEPGFILRALEQLDLQPGQRVLEIGSGGGWLAAVMAQVVGPQGKITGVEVIAELVAQSRRDLAALGIANVEIVAGDGALGHAAGAPYDRMIVTAGCNDLPLAFYDELRDGGLLIVPVRHRGGGEDLLVLRKRGERFVLVRATLAYFVPFTGSKALVAAVRPHLHDLPLWQALRTEPCRERPIWFGGPATSFELLTGHFRAFLGRIDPDFVAVQDELAFGLVDEAARSLALFRPYRLTGYGAPHAFDRAMAIYRLWCERGMPGAGAFNLTVLRADDPGPRPAGFPVSRGDSVFVWSLPEA
jgi:protein-L-isoaspartate(D-aspartate) O-methyltransferase